MVIVLEMCFSIYICTYYASLIFRTVSDFLWATSFRPGFGGGVDKIEFKPKKNPFGDHLTGLPRRLNGQKFFCDLTRRRRPTTLTWSSTSTPPTAQTTTPSSHGQQLLPRRQHLRRQHDNLYLAVNIYAASRQLLPRRQLLPHHTVNIYAASPSSHRAKPHFYSRSVKIMKSSEEQFKTGQNHEENKKKSLA